MGLLQMCIPYFLVMGSTARRSCPQSVKPWVFPLAPVLVADWDSALAHEWGWPRAPGLGIESDAEWVLWLGSVRD